MNQNQVKIKFECRNGNSLYDLSYIALDLNQLIVFLKMIERYDEVGLNKTYFNEKNGYSLNRNAKIIKEYSDEIKINQINNGCIEIILSGIGGMLSQVLLAIIADRINKHLDSKKNKIEFEISTQDEKVNEIIDNYKNKYFGKGDEGLANLFDYLRSKGYSIEYMNHDAYRIIKVIDRYEQRIVKIINKI